MQLSGKPREINNQLIIIGNGFDLAHGLPTSYNDFMLDYFKKIISDDSKVNKHGEFIHEDSLFRITGSANRDSIKLENLTQVKAELERRGFTVQTGASREERINKKEI